MVGIASGGTEGDDAQIGEAGKSGNDFLRHTVGQRGEIGIAATVFKWQHRDPESLVSPSRSRVCARLCLIRFCPNRRFPLRRAGRVIGFGNREPCFAQPVQDGLHEATGEMPGPDVRARVRGKLRIERQKIPDRGRGFGAPAEVTAGRSHDKVGPEESGYVDPVRAFEGLLVLALCESDPIAERNASSPHDWR